MRIVVHGQDAFGKAVLEKLLARGENVVAVCCAPDKAGRPEDPLKVFAREKGLPVHQPKSWKTPEALELMKSFNADVCMMAYVLLFVPQPVLDAPRLGTFQYHPSLLPAHRGPSSINWPIAMGKTKTGLTIFWPDEGLDEGPILMQKTVDIGPDETLGDVYFKKLFPIGVDAMIESLDLVKAGKAPKIEQDLADGSYESWFKKDLAEIDWSKPAAEIYNTIRAANPGARRLAHDQGRQGRHLRQRQGRRHRHARRDRRHQRRRHDGRRQGRPHPDQARARRRTARRSPPPSGPSPPTCWSAPRSIRRRRKPRRSRREETSRRKARGRQVRHRDRARREEEADPGDRRQARHPDRAPAALRPRQGEDLGRRSSSRSKGKKDGKLILVTAINPTPAGEGKTTTTVGLGDGLNRIGKKAAICLREPSLGPCFGVKGGAAGGGYAQVVPMEDINLHFTGDFHAITSAHNLLVGDDRQPHLLGQRAEHRHPPRRLAPRHGHERPRAARDRRARSAASPTASRARPASTSRSPPR